MALGVFKAKKGAWIAEKDAQMVGEAILAASGTDSLDKVSAEDVVAAAQARLSPLHRYIFTKGQEAAAHEFYLQQARHLIGSLSFELVVEGSTEPKEVRAFISVRSQEPTAGRSYVDSLTVLHTPEMREQYVEAARKEFLSLCTKYDHLEELAEVIAAVREALGAEVVAA